MHTQILTHQVIKELQELLNMKQDVVDHSEEIVVIIRVGQPIRIEYKTIARRDEATK